MLIVDRLSKVFSPDQLILTPPSEYFEDASLCQSFQPLCVIEAWTGGDVQEVLKIANECRIPVTVRGAGTSKSGGAVPEQGGIVLSVEKLNKILNVDVINRTVTVEPGVIV